MTVSGNKKSYSKRQIKSAERAKVLYKTLVYPDVRSFRWITASKQIKDTLVTVDDVDNAYSLWGKNIESLKANTTRGKLTPVAWKPLKVPKAF